MAMQQLSHVTCIVRVICGLSCALALDLQRRRYLIVFRPTRAFDQGPQ